MDDIILLISSGVQSFLRLKHMLCEYLPVINVTLQLLFELSFSSVFGGCIAANSHVIPICGDF